ncbi:YopJ family acetyltransferase [Vibrio mangrovi]|uniref:YopJ Serine/Threonine acetyltransferase n=1 Tax=Vibrio mangrovi TaxID=474394 RepID=A0A1Y6ITH2_9VIBR|nr:YopJ family acetyltransferase [Vibrio mangrovi]MDW6004688.1 YopJ family acetyltransferase [Vibrio mangrovi]SMS00979.1 YopJ Serine/Threonine acetyltransferase [Vibrio mangrovi]
MPEISRISVSPETSLPPSPAPSSSRGELNSGGKTFSVQLQTQTDAQNPHHAFYQSGSGLFESPSVSPEAWPSPPDSPVYPESPAATTAPELRRQNAWRETPESQSKYERHNLLRHAPIPDKPPVVPLRLQDKVDQIDLSSLEKLSPDLHQYAQQTISRIQKGREPNSAITTLDAKLLPLLAEAENHRHPGLNLHTFTDQNSCYEAIKAQQKTVQETKQPQQMRVVYPPLPGMAQHHIALDIRFKPGHQPSILGFESALSTLATEPIKNVLSQAFPKAKIQIVDHSIQNSSWDCVMFSLNNALKAYKSHEEYTDKIHNQAQSSRNPLKQIKQQLTGVKSPEIPNEFWKHTHSHGQIQVMGNGDMIVTKEKTGSATETLEHRNLAYRTQRQNHAYSTSIEGFRLQEIRRAGEYLAGQAEIKESSAQTDNP